MIVAVSVDGWTCEELRRFEQVSWSTRRIAIPEANVVNLAAPFDTNVLNRATVQEQPIDLIVEWEDELRVDFLLDERFRQRSRNVREPASFGKRHSFRRKNSDAHSIRIVHKKAQNDLKKPLCAFCVRFGLALH